MAGVLLWLHKNSAEKVAVMDVCLAMLEDAARTETSIKAGVQAGFSKWLRAFVHVCVSLTLSDFVAPLPALYSGWH